MKCEFDEPLKWVVIATLRELCKYFRAELRTKQTNKKHCAAPAHSTKSLIDQWLLPWMPWMSGSAAQIFIKLENFLQMKFKVYMSACTQSDSVRLGLEPISCPFVASFYPNRSQLTQQFAVVHILLCNLFEYIWISCIVSMFNVHRYLVRQSDSVIDVMLNESTHAHSPASIFCPSADSFNQNTYFVPVVYECVFCHFGRNENSCRGAYSFRRWTDRENSISFSSSSSVTGNEHHFQTYKNYFPLFIAHAHTAQNSRYGCHAENENCWLCIEIRRFRSDSAILSLMPAIARYL